jgi:hypothetical protein
MQLRLLSLLKELETNVMLLKAEAKQQWKISCWFEKQKVVCVTNSFKEVR